MPVLAQQSVPRRSDEPAESLTEFEAPNPAAAPTVPVTARPGATVGPQQKIPVDLWETIRAGGVLMYPIGACSILALAFSLERLVVLRRRRVIPKDFVTRFLDHLEQGQLDRRTALKLCEENGSPIAAIFAHAVRKWGKPSVEVEQAIIDGGERQVSQLRRHLRVLNAVATISPLLGLLGTVMGMIMCFNQIAGSSAMGKSEQLAGGIGIALITTAGGLFVAIPAMILYMFFLGRVDNLVMEMDQLSQRVANLISAESLTALPMPQRPAVAQKPKMPLAGSPEAKKVPADSTG
ncbi:MAG: MotA/TolQ/ExbB proton channel family protein [Planctomycetales bacterium]|nr:MotA/TolQ/ExbB proton channel family protein [Planctomycetales bacterium]